MRNYKAIDGLPQSQVGALLEDKNGYLWIGTEGGGVARFDGREFKVYTSLDGLVSNVVTHLSLDKQQNLWIVHPTGLTKFDGISFKKFLIPQGSGNSMRLRRIFQLNDTLFVTSAPGKLGKIYNDSVYYWARPIKEKASINYTHVKHNADLFMFLSDSTFLACTPSAHYTLPYSNHFKKIRGLFNYKNDVWIKTEKGFFTVDFGTRQFIARTFPIHEPIVCYDSINDVFWIAADNHILRKKILPNGIVQADTVLKDTKVNQVLVDSEGNTWLGTNGSGLFKYFIQDFDRYETGDISSVMAITKDHDGSMWLGTMTKGLYRIKSGDVKHYYFEEDHRNSVISLHASPKGELWVGTAFGLGLYNRASENFKWYLRKDGLSSETVFGVTSDDDGIWIATATGVNYYDGTYFKSFSTRDGLTSSRVNAIHYSKLYKKVFFGNESGLSTITNHRIESEMIGGIENVTIYSINAYRDSLLLLGTGGAGVIVYHPITRTRQHLTTHDGLSSDFIYFVAADTDDYIWIGSEKGITRVRLNTSLEITESRHYDNENGLMGVETNQNAFYLKDSEKYFGLVDGLYQFNNVHQNDRSAFKHHLTDVQVLYGRFSARSYSDTVAGFFKIPVNPQFPPDHNHLTFHFNRVDKNHRKSIKFRYILENFDKTWSPPSSVNTVTYSNLPPGEYVFRLQSTNSQGSWIPDDVVYAFTIKTPFYQTASFIVGLIVLIIGMVTLIFYIRVKQRIRNVVMHERIRAKEQENLRKEIARDFHDEMGNQLTRIINYISLMKLNAIEHNGKSTSLNKDLYTKVEDSAKYLYSGTRDFIWSIDPVNDELCKLFIHIRDFGEVLFEEKEIQFRAYNDIKEPTKLPYGFSREANLIFKEAMTNAFKYSSAKNVGLTLRRIGESFEMSFEDDGVGFCAGDVDKSNGLRNIRERADRINAVLRVQSVKNSGTKITLSFNLNKSKRYAVAV